MAGTITAQLIPTSPDEANYTLKTTLDGVPYALTFRYSGRASCWYLDLYLDDGTPLVMGRKVVCNFPIWRIFRYDPRVPQGVLVAIPVAGGSDAPPSLTTDATTKTTTGELGEGRRVQLFYISPDQLPASGVWS